jgi:O-antigen ligase
MKGAPEHRRRLDLIAVLLLGIVTLAVLPLGGNRPIVWGATGLALGLVVTAQAAIGGNGVQLPRWRWESWIFLAFLIFCLGQLLPVQTALKVGSTEVSGTQISLTPSESLLSLLTWVQYAVVFAFGTVLAQSQRRRNWMLEALFWVICAQAGFGLLSVFVLGDTLLGLPKAQYSGFATGTFVNRNAFASYIAAGLPIGLAILAVKGREGDPLRRAWEKAAVVVAMVVIVAALLVSGSRMGALAATLGASVTLGLVVLTGGVRRHAWLLGVCLIAAIAALLLFGEPLIGRVMEPGDDVATRVALYTQVWEAIGQSPLLGHGGGSFAAVFPVFQQPPLPGELVWQRAHSTYLSLWFEYGLLVGSLPIAIVLALWVTCLGKLVRCGTDLACLAVAGGVAALGCHALVDFGLEMHAVALLLSLVLGLSRRPPDESKAHPGRTRDKAA